MTGGTGTYLISGPNWAGNILSGMKEIKAPSNDGLIAICTLVKDPEGVSTIHSIQGKFVLSPLSILGVRELHPTTNSTLSSVVGGSGTNASKEIPVAPDPALIPKTGIKIFDEIRKDIVDNTQLKAIRR
ncbi:MAG TPA: DUF1254 domain-containing protein [Nitrososphaeraceae archaeon]|nr:DUF1254 domain-containing protein [Nitrososphaeraceae archaeon]